MRLRVFDIETNGLYPQVNVIHTLTVYDHPTDSYNRYDILAVKKGIHEVYKADCVVGHNIMGYDLPVIMKLYPKTYDKFSLESSTRFFDTMVVARLLFPDISLHDMHRKDMPPKLVGSQSLEAWGYRLGILKGEYGKQTDAWDRWTPEMSEYCEQDVRVTVALMNFLTEKFFAKYRWLPQTGELLTDIMTIMDCEPVIIEHLFAYIIGEQINHGINFNTSKAEQLAARLARRAEELEKELKTLYKGFWKNKGEFTPKADNKRFGYKKDCVCTRIEWVDFSPGSRDHIERYLRSTGWIPDKFTNKGSAKIDDELYDQLGDDNPRFKLIKEYFKTTKMLSMVATGDQAWLKLVEPDDKIRGYVNTGGAITRRCTHSKPNCAQVPKVLVDKQGNKLLDYAGGWGYEARSLFQPEQGWDLVGADAAGLELRCLAHYMHPWDNGKYAEAVINGKQENKTDIHSMNQIAANLGTRNQAKTFIYAFLGQPATRGTKTL